MTSSIMARSLQLDRFINAPLWLRPSQRPLQNDAGGVDVPMQNKSAKRANMHSLGKLLVNDPSAATALLACVPRIDQDEPRTSCKRLVRERLQEQAPACVGNRPGKPTVLEHVLDSQVLRRNQAKSVSDLPRFLVVEVPPLVSNLPVNDPRLKAGACHSSFWRQWAG